MSCCLAFLFLRPGPTGPYSTTAADLNLLKLILADETLTRSHSNYRRRIPCHVGMTSRARNSAPVTSTNVWRLIEPILRAGCCACLSIAGTFADYADLGADVDFMHRATSLLCGQRCGRATSNPTRGHLAARVGSLLPVTPVARARFGRRDQNNRGDSRRSKATGQCRLSYRRRKPLRQPRGTLKPGTSHSLRNFWQVARFNRKWDFFRPSARCAYFAPRPSNGSSGPVGLRTLAGRYQCWRPSR
jgi:hypothetical protein